MTLLEHLATWLVGWLTLAAICGLAWSVCVTRYKARQRADITRRAAYPPPPPAPRPRPVDDLLADVPVEILAVDELDRRFFAIVDAETRWFA